MSNYLSKIALIILILSSFFGGIVLAENPSAGSGQNPFSQIKDFLNQLPIPKLPSPQRKPEGPYDIPPIPSPATGSYLQIMADLIKNSSITIGDIFGDAVLRTFNSCIKGVAKSECYIIDELRIQVIIKLESNKKEIDNSIAKIESAHFDLLREKGLFKPNNRINQAVIDLERAKQNLFDVKGNIDQIIDAILKGSLTEDRFNFLVGEMILDFYGINSYLKAVSGDYFSFGMGRYLNDEQKALFSREEDEINNVIIPELKFLDRLGPVILASQSESKIMASDLKRQEMKLEKQKKDIERLKQELEQQPTNPCP